MFEMEFCLVRIIIYLIHYNSICASDGLLVV